MKKFKFIANAFLLKRIFGISAAILAAELIFSYFGRYINPDVHMLLFLLLYFQFLIIIPVSIVLLWGTAFLLYKNHNYKIGILIALVIIFLKIMIHLYPFPIHHWIARNTIANREIEKCPTSNNRMGPFKRIEIMIEPHNEDIYACAWTGFTDNWEGVVYYPSLSNVDGYNLPQDLKNFMDIFYCTRINNEWLWCNAS